MPTEEAFIRAMAAAPGDMLPQLIYADWLTDQGRRVGDDLREAVVPALMTMCISSVYGGDGGYGDGGDYGVYGDGYGGYGDGGDGYGGYGDGYGGYGDGGYGDGYGGYGDGYGGYGDGGERPYLGKRIANVTNGYYLTMMPGGNTPYVHVSWVEVNGLELVLHGARVVRRFGANMSLAELTANGPAETTQLLPAANVFAWRPNVLAIQLNIEKWRDLLPEAVAAAEERSNSCQRKEAL